MAVIAGVCASLANLAHTRHWYHLADCKMCEILKIRDTSCALQTYKPEGSAYDCWSGATLQKLAHTRNGYTKTLIKLQVVQILVNP